MIIHAVNAGETVNSIAENYGVPVARIIQDNELISPYKLVVGQTLVILYHNQVYVVRQGDTLYSISKAYGVTVNQLYRNNPNLKGISTIYPKQVLVIDYNNAPVLGTYSINGYAYPFIDKEVLKRTLPYLTYLTIFTYGFTPDGELITIDDQELIDIAREYGVAPLMLISTLNDEGKFSNELASTLLNNEALQNIVINNILKTLKEKNYYGLDIDFEYVFAKDKDAYASFIAKVTNILNAEGYIVITALAPKTSEDQKGLLYEGHDYKAIGAASNYVLLMTYEWGYTYGTVRYKL